MALNRWRECAAESQTVGKSWGIDFLGTPPLCLTVPSSLSFSVYSLSLGPSVCLPVCAAICFPQPLVLSAAFLKSLQGWTAYTAFSSVPSHQLPSMARVTKHFQVRLILCFCACRNGLYNMQLSTFIMQSELVTNCSRHNKRQI